MSINFKVDHEKQLITSTASGTFVEKEFFDFIHEIAELRQTVDYDHLVDLSAIDKVEWLNTDTIKHLTKFAASADKPDSPSKLALVGSSTIMLGLSRVYEVFRTMEPASTIKVSVFKTTDEAMTFLGDK